MKTIKFLFIGVLTMLTIVSCVKDELYEDPSDQPDVQESVIKINEVMSTGEPDWMELYNSSDAEIDLAGYVLADKSSEWIIPAGIKIASKGFVSFECDGDDVDGSTNFKISSGGEMVSLKDADGVLIDQIDVPSMVDYTGLTYARIPDGEDTWEVATPTKGAANSNENNPPVITAEDVTEFTEIYKIQVSDADGVASVKLVLITDVSIQTVDMILIDGDYKASVPTFPVGTKVEYYVEAKDITGKSAYYPEAGSEEPNFYYVTKGKPLFISVAYEGAQAGNLGDVTFTVDVFDNDSVEQVKLYYVITENGLSSARQDFEMSFQGDTIYVGVISSQNQGAIISYYLRAKNRAGEKTYYPTETGVTGDFDHDDLATWPTYMAGEPPVINGFSMLNITNVNADGDLQFNITYEYDETAEPTFKDVRLYYSINKDLTDAEFTQYIDEDDAGDPTNLDATRLELEIDVKAADDKYAFTIPATDIASGDVIRFYFRGYTKDGAGEKVKRYFTPSQDESFDRDTYSQWTLLTVN